MKIREKLTGRIWLLLSHLFDSEVGIVPEYIAHYLQVDENEPVMLLKNYMYDGDGRPLYLSSEVIVGTRYQISV